MPSPAEILCHRRFDFGDGTTGEKLFVILNTPDLDAPCLVLKVTSKPKRYVGSVKGCNPHKKVFYVPAGWQACFPVDTYVQLPQIHELQADELLRGAVAKYITLGENPLSHECFEQLMDCLRRFRDDISARHWEMIFR